jgi:hypothetical protein
MEMAMSPDDAAAKGSAGVSTAVSASRRKYLAAKRECRPKVCSTTWKPGETIDEFLPGFPSVRRKQVIALLEGFDKEILQPARVENPYGR